MNKEQRKELEQLSSQLTNELTPLLKTLESLEEAVGKWAYADVEQERDVEQEKYDNLPEAFQSGEKGELAQEVIQYLDNAMEQFETAKDTLAELAGKVTEAQDAINNGQDELTNAVSA